MNRSKFVFAVAVAMILCLSVILSGCGGEKTYVDYGDIASFEAALNDGQTVEGKVVSFTAEKVESNPLLGFFVTANDSIDFVFEEDPGISEGDTVAIRVAEANDALGIWMVSGEKLKKAVFTDDTITMPDETEAPTETPTTEAPTEKEKDTESESKSESTYSHNEYYDLVEEGRYTNTLGHTTLIHKVLAKKDVTVSSTLVAYAENGDIIGKSESKIVLTSGEYNFFSYYFSEDISDASFEVNAQAQEDSFMIGERGAAEMEKYNLSGSNLYVTIKQTGDEIGAMAKFKLLFYSGDEIVRSENECFFSIYANNLSGKGSSDIAEILVYGVDFDRVEFVYEP